MPAASPSTASHSQSASAAATEALDTLANAWRARFTGGISPVAGMLAWYDWALNISLSPGKQYSVFKKGLEKQHRFANYLFNVATHPNCVKCIEPLEQDRRFSDPAWDRWPFNAIHQGFLLQQQWLHNATSGVRGVSEHHEKIVTFSGRQWLDIWSPANFFWTNPEAQQALLNTGGASLWQGATNLVEDVQRVVLDEPPAGSEDFIVGKDVGLTPGKVVFRNHLIELIQYKPATPKVKANPILIVPSWIMKYYILDLSPHNSMVRYLVEQGHTVFMVSWKNPDRDDRDLGMEDYLQMGIMEALEAVKAIVPRRKVQAVGYCLGGTLLAIAAAAMARDHDDSLQSLTLLAAETDFRESGEIALFIDESQIAWLEAAMWSKGYLEGHQMAGAFQLLNSRDLIWSRQVREYLLGERQGLFDLMAWNADVTRMPYRMHSEYLRWLYLENNLAEGRYLVNGHPIALEDITVPLFAVGTVRDHVAPWQSVYKLHLLTDTDVTFVLTSGGHNAGVVSEPGRPRRSYQAGTRKSGDKYIDPARWRENTPTQEGSWWLTWNDWLTQQTTDDAAPPRMGNKAKGYAPLTDAPGDYVMQR